MATLRHQPENTLGISIPALRDVAKTDRQGSRPGARAVGFGHPRGAHPGCPGRRAIQVTPEQMDAWAADFDSWDVCDQVCANLFDRTPHRPRQSPGVERACPEEFVKRAGFALMACLAWHDKKARRRPLRELPARHPARRHSTSATSSKKPSTGLCARSASATAA